MLERPNPTGTSTRATVQDITTHLQRKAYGTGISQPDLFSAVLREAVSLLVLASLLSSTRKPE